MARRFEIVDANTKLYRRYNALERQLAVRLIPLQNYTNPEAHYLGCVIHLIEHALRDVDDGVMVGMTIQIQVNQSDKPLAQQKPPIPYTIG